MRRLVQLGNGFVHYELEWLESLHFLPNPAFYAVFSVLHDILGSKLPPIKCSEFGNTSQSNMRIASVCAKWIAIVLKRRETNFLPIAGACWVVLHDKYPVTYAR